MNVSYIPQVRCSLVKEGRCSVSSRNVSTPDDAAAVFSEYLADADREHFAVLSLDIRNRAIHIHTASIGTLTEAIVHPREVFKAALIAGASSVILGHNHPSGDPNPSPADVATTRRLVECGKTLGIDVMDHVIVGESWYSLRQNGLMD